MSYMSNTVVVAVPCHLCGLVTELEPSIEGFMAWKNGELIQDAMPELDADERELLISGTCPKCWDEMFPPDSEEDE